MRIDKYVGDVEIHIDTSRIDKNTREAQMLLNTQVAADCDPLIPFRQGALRNSLNYPNGIYGGEIEWNTPYAHYMYQGIVYAQKIPIKDSDGNITEFLSPPKKHPTDRSIKYHTPGTGKEWFEKAKEKYKQDWVDLVGKTIGKD